MNTKQLEQMKHNHRIKKEKQKQNKKQSKKHTERERNTFSSYILTSALILLKQPWTKGK